MKLTLTCFSVLASAVFANQTSTASLKVMTPKSLVDKIHQNGEIASSLGNFGHIQYGTSLNAPVYYPTTCTDGCCDLRDESTIAGFLETEANRGIIMVDRRGGDCSFIDKVRNIENAGATMALIADGI